MNTIRRLKVSPSSFEALLAFPIAVVSQEKHSSLQLKSVQQASEQTSQCGMCLCIPFLGSKAGHHQISTDHNHFHQTWKCKNSQQQCKRRKRGTTLGLPYSRMSNLQFVHSTELEGQSGVPEAEDP